MNPRQRIRFRDGHAVFHDETENTEPQESDYILSAGGILGGVTVLSEYEGKELGCFEDDESALIYAYDRMEREKFWPNIWQLSDHGNWHLLTKDDSERGTT